IVIQNYLNMILPCLIAFAFTMMCYVLIKKKNWTPVKCIALFLVIGIVGAAFGIWAGSYTPLVPVPWSVVA
ncbi:MAG: PTS system mannose/fructose/sorbose family transporter subunit IID, partial [Holdemanella biformis]